MVVSVTNAGPGVAYAGTASAAIVFGDGKSEYPQVDIEKRLAEIISSAASRHLTKQVADEPGKSFDREIEATVLDKDWVKVVRGEADAYYWQHMLT